MSNLKSLNTDLGVLLLRISMGGLMLFHGIAKLTHGHGFIKGVLVEKGLPKTLWLGVPLTEVIAPVFLILGIFTRLSGLAMGILMVFTIFLVHSADIFTLTKTGAPAIELNLLYLFGGLALFFTGGGKYTLYKQKNDMLK